MHCPGTSPLVNAAKVDEKDEGHGEEAAGEDEMGDLRVLCFTTLGIVYFTL